VVNILILYHSITGNVKLVADEIAAGAHEVPGTQVLLKDAERVTDEDLCQADGIAFGSPKYYGSFSPPLTTLFERIFGLREHFYYKVGTAFTGSPTQYGGQEHVIDDLVHAMMQTGRMIVVGDALAETGFVGGYTVGVPDGKAKRLAQGLGKRLALVAGLLKKGNPSEVST
jgi:NAD(P)H dehydrogenase (quinone)